MLLVVCDHGGVKGDDDDDDDAQAFNALIRNQEVGGCSDQLVLFESVPVGFFTPKKNGSP